MFSICFACETEPKRFFLLSSFENVVHTPHIGGLCFVFLVFFFSSSDLIYSLLFFCLNDLWFTMCISRILSLEQYLYHVIPVKPLHPRNRLQVSIITEAIVLLIWKVFWIHSFPPMLGNVNRAAATGISPVSAVETILSYSTKGIKLRDVNRSWYFRHLKMGYFKLLHNSGDYLYISEKASFQLSRINSSPQFHIMKKKCLSVHGWNLCWHLYSGCPFTKNEAWVPGWWLTWTHLWKHACVCGSPWWPEAPSLELSVSVLFGYQQRKCSVLAQQQLHVLMTICQFPDET